MWIYVSIHLYLGTDFNGGDVPTGPIVLSPDGTNSCFNIGILDDSVIEFTESFRVSLSIDEDSPEAFTLVKILDDDGTRQ